MTTQSVVATVRVRWKPALANRFAYWAVVRSSPPGPTIMLRSANATFWSAVSRRALHDEQG